MVGNGALRNPAYRVALRYASEFSARTAARHWRSDWSLVTSSRYRPRTRRNTASSSGCVSGIGGTGAGGSWSQTDSERGVNVVGGLPKLAHDDRINGAAIARH